MTSVSSTGLGPHSAWVSYNVPLYLQQWQDQLARPTPSTHGETVTYTYDALNRKLATAEESIHLQPLLGPAVHLRRIRQI